MALPWLGALKAKYDRIKSYVRAQEVANEMAWEYIDRAPGWTYVDCFYSLSAPPGYELDPAVVRFIKSFCPDYIPTWETKTYLPPYDNAEQAPETFVRHCIARYVSNPKIPLHTFPKMLAPIGYTGKLPNYLEQVIVGGDDPRASDLPGLYAPLDFARAEALRKVYDRFKDLNPSEYAEAAVMEGFNATAFEIAKKQAARKEAEQYVSKQLTKYLKTVSDAEALNLMCGEQEEIRKGYAFLKSGQMPSPLASLAANPMAGLPSPPKEQA